MRFFLLSYQSIQYLGFHGSKLRCFFFLTLGPQAQSDAGESSSAASTSDHPVPFGKADVGVSLRAFRSPRKSLVSTELTLFRWLFRQTTTTLCALLVQVMEGCPCDSELRALGLVEKQTFTSKVWSKCSIQKLGNLRCSIYGVMFNLWASWIVGL